MNWDEAKRRQEEFNKICKIKKPCFAEVGWKSEEFERLRDCDSDFAKTYCIATKGVCWETCLYGKESYYYQWYERQTECPLCLRLWGEFI